VVAKIQESDDNANWQHYTGGAFQTVTAANDNAVQEKDYTGTKQYIRIVATVAGAACEFSADVLTKSGDSTEDTTINNLITSAREDAEDITRRAFATQTLEAYLDYFPHQCDIELPNPPLQSVTSVKYKNSAGVEVTMTANTDYIVDTDRNIGRIVLPYGKTWPSFTPYTVNPIKIRYVAGYTAENPIPEKFKQAMLLHIGFYYYNRDAVSLDEQTNAAISRLLTSRKAGFF
jgi:uncharacterized phiE125 gp8 family phage protein